jgi:demethylmenaquinone methyltransferase / 2-methoxy-6-polyprenyl-1,4-benzoquinol methylase
MLVAQVEQRIWETEGEAKREAVRALFSEIAPRYDLMNSLMSFSLHRRWRAFAVSLLDLKERECALDVCCGTGDFLSPLRKAIGSSGRLIGIDFCRPMLERAKGKGGELTLGDACRLPVRSESFHAVTVGWGIRNVPDIDLAHREIARVLKPGGRFVSLDMAQPTNAVIRTASTMAFRTVVPALGALLGNRSAYTYLPKSTERFWSREELAASMKRAGFEAVVWRSLFLGNICVHYGRKA